MLAFPSGADATLRSVEGMNVATSYDLTSGVEFDYSFNGAFPVAVGSVFSAFNTSALSIVAVSFGTYQLTVGGTVNAGYYSHITYNPTLSGALTTVFDIGYTSQASSSSYYTTAANKLTTVPDGNGPSDGSSGFGTLELGSNLANVSLGGGINFEGAGNTLVLDGSGVSPSLATTISGFNGANDQIVFSGIGANAAAITGYSNGVLTFTNAGVSNHITFGNMGTGVSAANFKIGNAAQIEGGNGSAYTGDLVISFVACFLRGTMIATPAGETAVEDLRAGDLVTVVEQGRHLTRPVAWVGGRAIRTTDFDGRDEAFPIRILKDAFAPRVPHRDLLVTPEHCILTEAGLTPARMLVNGASILIDRGIAEYDYFHVELDRHAILLSENLATESYLDSGNRDLFVGAAATVSVRPGIATAAPLAVSRVLVEPIWTGLAERARSLGLSGGGTAVALTDQPHLRLLLDDGRELPACWHNSQRHMFHIPHGARPVRLLSRTAVPAEVIGPFVDDRRSLGVAVDRLVLWTGLDERVLPASGLDLAGWHGREGDTRWTDGNAELDLPEADADTFLDIHLAATMLYRDVPLAA